MTVSQALRKYSGLEIELLLAFVLKKPKEFLFMNPEKKLSSSQAAHLINFARRRNTGEPVAYLLGYKDFYGLRFLVNKNVLIPRPETEWLVQRVATLAERQKHPLRVLDIGTGSGCIAVSLARDLGARGKVFSSDISKKALGVAKKNAKAHGQKIKVFHSNLLEKIPGDFDVMVANLPYGWQEWKNNSQAETRGLQFEPKSALFTSQHGLKEIFRLLKQLVKKQIKPKFLYLEFDPRQKAELALLIKKTLPEAKFGFFRDVFGRWRFVEIRFY